MARQDSTSNSLPPDGSLLFVYGTLQRGGQYHHFLNEAEAEFIDHGRTAIAYPLVVDAYPCLLDRPGHGFHVRGEIYRIAKSTGWIRIDYLEGHPTEYLRRQENITTGNGILAAWTYFYIQPIQDLARLPVIEAFDVAETS